MASGIWTWNRYWYDYQRTESAGGACVRACYQAGLKELLFTMWGDNGAYCDPDSAFAGMVFGAEIAFGCEHPDPERLERRFGAVCGGSYAAHRMAGAMHRSVVAEFDPNLWDDPFFETQFRTWAKNDSRTMAGAAREFAAFATRLKGHVADRRTGDLRHAYRIADAFAKRYALSAELLAAYRKRDRSRLRNVRRLIRPARAAVRAAADSFREMWLSRNKPEGLEFIQGRFGMLEARYAEMDRRLAEFVAGKIDRLAELDHRCPPGRDSR
jgi:hexosaminidase